MKLINVFDEVDLKAVGIPYTRKSLYQMHYIKSKTLNCSSNCPAIL